MIAYAELQVTSNYSFLRGASHPSELVDQAAELGHTAIALTDRNTLAGVVRRLSVGSKRFLVNKVDRSVTGLIAQQQCVGPLQLPVDFLAEHFRRFGSD